MRQKIASFLIVCMALVQIGLAHHATVHVQEALSFEASSGHPHHPGDHSKKPLEPCQICLGAKALAHGLVSSPVLYDHTAASSSLSFFIKTSVPEVRGVLSYHARGPPSFSV